MAKDKDKHPSWFKMKLERRELVRQLSPETAANVWQNIISVSVLRKSLVMQQYIRDLRLSILIDKRSFP